MLFAGNRMLEAEQIGMQGLPPKGCSAASRAAGGNRAALVLKPGP